MVLFKSESEGPDKFVQQLQENNFEARFVNCLSFKFKNLEKLCDEIEKVDDYQGLIFTSLRSIQAVQNAVESGPLRLSRWQGKSNYSVGESTSEAAKNLLGLDTEGSGTGNAQTLASLIVEKHSHEQAKPFLFPSGNLKQETLEKSLNENSIEVQNVEVYETVQHPELESSIKELKTAKIDFLVFFSPSGAKFSLPFLQKYELNLDGIKIIAIGPSTKKYLEEINLKCFQMCSKPTPESLLEALNK